MRTDFLDGLRVNAGASMSLVAATTALLLQYLCVELLLNGSSKKRSKLLPGFGWIHRHIEGSISAEMRKELGIPEEIEKYGYMNELKAYIMQTLTWARWISFQDRFGQRLSGQAKDTIVLEYTCAGMRLGYELSGTIMHNIEASIISSKKHWVTGLLSSLQMVHSMDVIQDKPVISKANGTQTVSAPPNYLAWLASGRQRPAMMQLVLVRTLEQQLQSDSWINAIRVCVQETVTTWRSQFKESSLFHSGREVKLPVHVGIIIDGNRRYARQRGQHASVGHAQGAATPSDSSNGGLSISRSFGRREKEPLRATGIGFKSLAFTSLLHLFRIRVRFIGGDRHRFPLELRETMAMVEDITSLYDGVFLQTSGRIRWAPGSGVRGAESRGARDRNHRAEHRTSGFFLWIRRRQSSISSTKLWPEITEMDWLQALDDWGRAQKIQIRTSFVIVQKSESRQTPSRARVKSNIELGSNAGFRAKLQQQSEYTAISKGNSPRGWERAEIDTEGYNARLEHTRNEVQCKEKFVHSLWGV
ncbi:hypothetical protein B0H14DRAFT_2624993 [Mycena olivaceomarginata]|nr:hypothetical protein B0H14DRAFT_2624993 [Mycena olivaceomarginata]